MAAFAVAFTYSRCMSWISATLGGDHFLLFAYTDPAAGPSGKGIKLAGDAPTHEEAHRAVHAPTNTVRLPGVATAPLSNDWVEYLQLPASPPWMAHFAPARPAPWRNDPAFAGRFHPQFADDIEAHFVLLGKKTIEKMWVRLDEVVPGVGYRGGLLNTSHLEPSLAAGARVMVRPSHSHPPAMWVPDGACADNLRAYSSVCEKCGFDLIFIPIADLARMQFPDAPPNTMMEQMTTRCLMCRSTMHVAKRK
jgi:hypothetical protein